MYLFHERQKQVIIKTSCLSLDINALVLNLSGLALTVSLESTVGVTMGDFPLLSLFASEHSHFLFRCIRALQRNPLIPKLFLSAGSWCCRVWSEEVFLSFTF